MESGILHLTGKCIWVFGGAGYLGRATQLLVAAGAEVLCIDLEDRAQQFIDTENLHDKVSAATFNVHHCDLIKEFVTGKIDQQGVPHGLVNLTYASTAKALEDLTRQDFDDVSHGSLTSSFLLAREVGSRMAALGRGKYGDVLQHVRFIVT